MEWEGREETQNVEDSRGLSGRTAAIGGGGIGIVVLALIIGNLLGIDPQKLIDIANQGAPPGGVEQKGITPAPADPHEERNAHFAKIIMHDTETVWTELFAKMGRRYPIPTLHLFRGSVDTGCGPADAGVGPFYCPADEKVYIDLGFYDELEKKLQAPGDFAKAYVLAHEVGHHVQKQLGYSRIVDQIRAQGDKQESLQASVRLELQADFFAGVWGHYAGEKFKNYIQPGDVESAMNAAKQIGDDTLQKKFTGRVRPDTFTHGSSAQRMKWFMEGFKTGDVNEAKKLFDMSVPSDQL
jgi:uncharacterized protein